MQDTGFTIYNKKKEYAGREKLALLKRIIFTLFLFTCPMAWGSVDVEDFDRNVRVFVTDESLKELAIQKGIVPESVDEQEELDKKNTVILWIIYPRTAKLNLIDNLKEYYKNDSVTILNPSDFYVNEINTILYNSLQGDNVFGEAKKGIGVIFKTIAIMDGDFDNGEDKLELLKKWLGPESFAIFEETYPDKVEKLKELKGE